MVRGGCGKGVGVGAAGQGRKCLRYAVKGDRREAVAGRRGDDNARCGVEVDRGRAARGRRGVRCRVDRQRVGGRRKVELQRVVCCYGGGGVAVLKCYGVLDRKGLGYAVKEDLTQDVAAVRRDREGFGGAGGDGEAAARGDAAVGPGACYYREAGGGAREAPGLGGCKGVAVQVFYAGGDRGAVKGVKAEREARRKGGDQSAVAYRAENRVAGGVFYKEGAAGDRRRVHRFAERGRDRRALLYTGGKVRRGYQWDRRRVDVRRKTGNNRLIAGDVA